jgi:hypothetical protein
VEVGPTSIVAAKQVATRNILAPLLWLCAIVSGPAALGAAFASATLLAVLLILALAPPLFTLVAYAYWTFKDPDRLQSEQFVLQQRWMESQALIGDNRTKEVFDLSPQQNTLTANTAPSGEGSRG